MKKLFELDDDDLDDDDLDTYFEIELLLKEVKEINFKQTITEKEDSELDLDEIYLKEKVKAFNNSNITKKRLLFTELPKEMNLNDSYKILPEKMKLNQVPMISKIFVNTTKSYNLNIIRYVKTLMVVNYYKKYNIDKETLYQKTKAIFLNNLDQDILNNIDFKLIWDVIYNSQKYNKVKCYTKKRIGVFNDDALYDMLLNDDCVKDYKEIKRKEMINKGFEIKNMKIEIDILRIISENKDEVDVKMLADELKLTEMTIYTKLNEFGIKLPKKKNKYYNSILSFIQNIEYNKTIPSIKQKDIISATGLTQSSISKTIKKYPELKEMINNYNEK